MPKLIDIVKSLNGVINDNEFSAVIGSSDPFNQELSEESAEKIRGQIGSLMTFDSAVNNDKVIKALKEKVDEEKKDQYYREATLNVYTKAENMLSELGDVFNVDLKDKKLKDQVEALKSVKVGGKQDDSVYQSEISKLNEALSSKDQEFESFKKKSEQDFNNYKINTKLDSLFSGYQLAEPYQDSIVKNGIYSTIKNELANKVSLKLDGDKLVPYQKDNPELKYFEGNKEADVKDLVEPLISKFIAKNDGAKKSGNEPPSKPVSPDDRSARGQMKKKAAFI